MQQPKTAEHPDSDRPSADPRPEAEHLAEDRTADGVDQAASPPAVGEHPAEASGASLSEREPPPPQSAPLGGPIPSGRPRLADAAAGLLIIVLSFAGSMLYSLWARDAAIAPPAAAPGPPRRDFPGFPARVRPFEVLDVARGLTVRQLFQGFVAEGMTSEGTIDLTLKKNSLRFSFQDQKGRGPQPYREGGTLPIRTYCGRQSVVADSRGMVAQEDIPNVPCSRPEPRELPTVASCRIEDVWKVAKRHDFRLNKPARVEYFRAKGGPAYRLVQKDRRSKTLTLVVSARDCRSVLEGKQQRGSVP